MGEMAKFLGQAVKIGTCENLDSLRADQMTAVEPMPGNIDPVRDAEKGIRFRFPWPDEDEVNPGEFAQLRRSVALDAEMPPGVEHSRVQFQADAGYLLSMPCPEGTPNISVARNGFGGAVRLVQQRWMGGKLVAICECGGCGARFRYETFIDAAPLIQAALREGDRLFARSGRQVDGDFFYKIALRIAAGYKMNGPPLPTSPEATR